MSCQNQNDEVYMDLMNQRTAYDKDMIKQYNCVNFQMKYPQSLLSMLPPDVRVGFPSVRSFNPSVDYQLNPTMQSVKAAQGSSQDVNVYPPACGFANMPQNLCQNQTSYYYPGLDYAYNPTVGSKCINLGQDLNLQYVRK